MIKVRCTKSISLGLFFIEKDSIWIMNGIKFNDIPQSAKVHITEYKDSGMWAEITQAMLAECFEPLREEAA